MSTYLRYTLIILFCSLMILLCAVGIVYAQTNGFVPLAETPAGSKLGNLYQSGSMSDFINGIFKFVISVGAIVAVLRIAYAGYLYMGSADMWSSKAEAKHILADVTLGLLLLLSIYLILYQINPDILRLDALKNIKPATPAGQTQ